MRRPVGVLLLVALAVVPALAATSPEASFELGLRAFRAGDYASSAVDLRAAADASTGAAQETALVYLALSEFRLGREDDARVTITRLLEAERVAPAYATLPLQADAADFETLVAALVPAAALPRNTQLAVEDPSAALPAVRPATPAVAVDAATDVRVEEIQKQTESRIAAIEAEADRRIAEIQADADRRIAAAQAAANERVARAQADANARVAAAEGRANRDADARIAAMERPAPQEPPSRRTMTGSAALTSLAQADQLARNGEVDAAHDAYVRLASDRNVPREVLGESAVGLYRIGSYRESADAFRRMSAFARGEEDLRYYFAVALYESGHYTEAQKELSCALPFIQQTDDVLRYRMKIEQSAATTVARNF